MDHDTWLLSGPGGPHDDAPAISVYRCLGCGLTVEREPDDDFPQDDEHCSHEFEEVAGDACYEDFDDGE